MLFSKGLLFRIDLCTVSYILIPSSLFQVAKMKEKQMVHNANMDYEMQLLDQAGNLPLDVVRNILTSHVVSAANARSSGIL